MIDPDDAACVPSLLKLGVAGIILKDSPCSELAAGIAAIIKGVKYLSPEIRDLLQLGFNQKSGGLSFTYAAEELTSQEQKILRLIADGLPNKQIANKLAISIRTVENHRFSLTKKLGLKNVAGLTKFAIEHCLTTFD